MSLTYVGHAHSSLTGNGYRAQTGGRRITLIVNNKIRISLLVCIYNLIQHGQAQRRLHKCHVTYKSLDVNIIRHEQEMHHRLPVVGIGSADVGSND